MANDHIADDRKKVRLIDADAAVEKARASDEIVGSSVWDTSEVIEFLDDCPTVDAAPVVHGEWERIEDDFLDLVNLKCSVCGEEWCFEDYDDCVPQNYRYCPNCGAKMDGGSDNE